MILTGKAKQDFEDWYTARSPSAHALLLVHFYNKVEIEQYAWYIEWFDSTGIHVDIHPVGWDKINFTFNIYLSKNPLDNHCGYAMYDARQESTKQAIIHANEIYNNRNNNQD